MIRDRKPTTRPFESTPFRIYIYMLAAVSMYVKSPACAMNGWRCSEAFATTITLCVILSLLSLTF